MIMTLDNNHSYWPGGNWETRFWCRWEWASLVNKPVTVRDHAEFAWAIYETEHRAPETGGFPTEKNFYKVGRRFAVADLALIMAEKLGVLQGGLGGL
ncbi:uncharacterized protein N7511_007660 [Penicillium nucicola]|uniref:uncharacterized protein n=1 Tax=Penicillium nucicola TaxID=1850975 RepID=UPI00254590D7|nr:uncharacterized protein N7511_007660 [Penicillium nucicola]KAJ5753507.1 hypothetical protein N7511_007660 [Penicillium nucicola]